MSREPAFDIEVTADGDLSETLIVGVADIGVAGLTAVDYLTTRPEASQIGHVRTRNVPDITPFSEGEPRRPMRLYDAPEASASVFLSEVLLPLGAAEAVAESLFGLVDRTGVEEVVVLFGAPFPHRETEHEVFHVSTAAFRERRLAETDVKPLPNGFFDGVVGELVTRGLDDGAPPVGVLVTPAHPPGPDLDGALRLLDAYGSVFDTDIDRTELATRSEEMKTYYQGLADRMETLRESERSGQDYPADRMYM